MNLSKQIAKHFREVYFGGNWTCSNFKDNLAGVDWVMATTKIPSFNTIAMLTYHIHYYVHAVIQVLQGGELNAHDQYSFDLPPINSQQDWDNLLDKMWSEAEIFATLVEQIPEEKYWQNIAEEKHGNYYRNIHGIIEHAHYHLGQIAIIKKMIAQTAEN